MIRSIISIRLKEHKSGTPGLCSYLLKSYILVGLLLFMISCGNDLESKKEEESVDISAVYIPKELQEIDLHDSKSKWCFQRSKQSEHFIVFWDVKYGESEPGSTETPEKYRVDIDDLLKKAEDFYKINVNVLKFAEVGVGKSYLDKYKMMIFINYQDEWLATGAGYDDIIGALWVSPQTCQPVGSTIAHEIGHSFQYQVFCDLKEGAGFRYGFGGNGGNTFWEQTAQWQACQSYPGQVFRSYDFPEYTKNYHRHVCHESYRYASYFIHYYWANKHGIDIIGRIWREAKQPEDPIQAYMRITGINVEQMNDEMYEAASRFATWDLDAIRSEGMYFIDKHEYKLTTVTENSYQVPYDYCPGTTGYNVIPLTIPESNTIIRTTFKGIANAENYNKINIENAGWRYGYVALLKSGKREYSRMYSENEGIAEFTVPENCANLWFVVTGAPTVYIPHAWDEDEKNDEQWPYQVIFNKTNLLGREVVD